MSPHSPLQSALRTVFLCSAFAVVPQAAVSQEMVVPGQVMVVNMINPAQGMETNRDSEPNLAVNPANPMQIAASAFTPDPDPSRGHAPIYVSVDGGRNWNLNPILPFNHPDTGTGDITLRFASLSNVLYVAALDKTGSPPSLSYDLNILRTHDFTGANLMQVLVGGRGPVDQPWVQAVTMTTAAGAMQDRVYVAYSDLQGAGQRTPTVDRTLDAANTPPPSGFEIRRLPARNGVCPEGPTRVAVHDDGTVYAAYFQFVGSCGASRSANLTVVRDDNWAAAAFGLTFADLKDPSDGENGRIVANNIPIPWTIASSPSPIRLGAQRITGHLSIAVDPSDSKRVFLAWGQGTGAADYTLHVRSSNDGGATWSGDLITVARAVNPALAINSQGTVGFLYQALVSGDRWETHLLRSAGDFAPTSTRDTTLHQGVLPAQDAGNGDRGGGPLGDYKYLMAVGADFYGVFSASNEPNPQNFPAGVEYRRGHDFTNNRLLAPDGSRVEASIDPFFFIASEPIWIDRCARHPWLCEFNPKLSANLIKLSCPLRGCIVVDTFAKNCQLKFKCPGCPSRGMCPPYYHVHLDGLKNAWRVGLFDAAGRPVKYRQFKTARGIVLSFRPSKRDFADGRLGSYLLAFELGANGRIGTEYSVRTRLVRSDRHFQNK